MASTAMRLVIIAACAGAFYVLIGGFHSKFPLPLSFFETQGCARPALSASTANTSSRVGFVSVFEKADVVHEVAELLHVVLLVSVRPYWGIGWVPFVKLIIWHTPFWSTVKCSASA